MYILLLDRLLPQSVARHIYFYILWTAFATSFDYSGHRIRPKELQ
jgi:hypothetical protein